MPAYVAGAMASERSWTLSPSTRVTGGLRMTWFARPHSGVRFHPRAEVARHSERADLSLAVVDHCDLQAIAVEDDCFSGHDEGRCLAWNLELDSAVDAGRKRASLSTCLRMRPSASRQALTPSCAYPKFRIASSPAR